MSPLAQLFRRHRDRLAGSGYWVNPPPDLPWRDFAGNDAPVFFVQDEPTRRALAQAGASVRFEAFPAPPPMLRLAVLGAPREKARLRMIAHALASGLAEDGAVFVAGELKAGGKSIPRQLEPWFGSIRKVDSARHCVLFEVREPRPGEPFVAGDYEERWSLPDGSLEVASYPGVFAHGGLDAGTAQLLSVLNAFQGPAPGRALDLGCGCGVIGARLLQRHPGLDLVMADSSALALAATRRTLALNGLEAQLQASDGLRGITGRFDLIVSNPPFHEGHRERSDRGAGVFEGIRNFLAPRGQLLIVANRHLPWPRWMDRELGSHEVLSADAAFHVLQHRQTRGGPDRQPPQGASP